MALVTGAAQGIGRATALRLSADGMLVVVNDRKPSEELDRIVEECGGIPAIADVSDPHAVEEMVSRIEAEAGPL
ncbi:SDR family NAD(P)-dependent oxidoreductase, partial [Rubrobacter calidifluminis]|uniref:SDR family NAD(P)-dependent oxidoreductase n=1 Tax=Rubrobacter calidifluminis TaxID=1392640 RepID=UPI00235F34DB